jgi:hypothetical protein
MKSAWQPGLRSAYGTHETSRLLLEMLEVHPTTDVVFTGESSPFDPAWTFNFLQSAPFDVTRNTGACFLKKSISKPRTKLSDGSISSVAFRGHP